MLAILKQLQDVMDQIPQETLQPFFEKYMDKRKGKAVLAAENNQPAIYARCH